MAKTHFGGQAVLEGVMMRGRGKWAVAVRRPTGEVVVHSDDVGSLSERVPILKYPIIRGVLSLVEALMLAVKALGFSAQESTDEDIEISAKSMTVAIGVAMVLSVGLFIVLPAVLVRMVDTYLPSTTLFNMIEGSIRIAIFLGYLVLISQMKDISRVFEYHGAEHKVINAFESGDEITADAAAKYSTRHVRCGTSFLLIVMVVSILVFTLLGRPPTLLARVLSRLVVVPFVAGISYELIKFAGAHDGRLLVRILTAPGLWLQRLTTREPSQDQLEVAVVSLKKVIELENVEGPVTEGKETAPAAERGETAPAAERGETAPVDEGLPDEGATAASGAEEALQENQAPSESV